MSAVSGHLSPRDARDGSERTEDRAPNRLLFDISGVDLTNRSIGREAIEKLNPHRGDMSLLDYILWVGPEHRQSVALKQVRANEFWVPGHFPDMPLLPGVLMIEAAAQLACYVFNDRRKKNLIAAFLRIEDASFRSSVAPGDDLLLLCREVHYGRRRFIVDTQGVVGDRIAFEARLSGMVLRETAEE